MNKVILPDARNAFEINDFEGNKAIVVIANGQNGDCLLYTSIDTGVLNEY